MSDTVIKVENLSKQYRSAQVWPDKLGQVGTGTLSHDLKATKINECLDSLGRTLMNVLFP